jgi:hypothetical protein
MAVVEDKSETLEVRAITHRSVSIVPRFQPLDVDLKRGDKLASDVAQSRQGGWVKLECSDDIDNVVLENELDGFGVNSLVSQK